MNAGLTFLDKAVRARDSEDRSGAADEREPGDEI